jgi:ABC-type transport system involved in cytochrome c biogenesis permease component
MPFLPIAARELRVAARRRATYRTRFWAVFFAVAAFTWEFLTLSRARIPSTMHGRILFTTISGLAFVYCLFIGARATADCLSEEKREGTLGLLFLTDLKGYDVVFGKLVANSLNAFYGLVAVFPIIAICWLLGGVSFQQFSETVLVLVTTLFFSLSAGIFVSTYNRLERVAMFFTILLILACTFGPVLLGFVLSTSFGVSDTNIFAVMFTPAMSLLVAMEPATGGRFPNFVYSASLATTWILTISLLWGASRKLPHSWQEKKPKPTASKLKTFQLPQPNRIEANKFRAETLDKNPFLWLTLRGREKLNHAWGFVLAMILIWSFGFLGAGRIMWDYDLLFPTLLFIHAFLKIWVISESCTRLVEDRRSGALELLLSTPLDAKEIILGQHLALRRQFGGPFLLLMVLESLCFFFGISGRETNWSRKLFLPSAMILFVADYFTLRWVAMWIGLNAKNINRAVLKTALLVLSMPWIIYLLLANLVPFIYLSRFSASTHQILTVLGWIGIALFTNLILFVWAKSNLLTRFRLLATQPVRANP